MEDIELKRFWEKIKEELISSLPESVHHWIYMLEISGYDKGVLTVVTGQSIALQWLKKNYLSQINEILQKVTKVENARVEIVFDANAAKKIKKEVEKMHKKEAEAQQKERAMENLSFMQSSSNLNLKYKFENYVVGKGNKFAYDIAMSVAKNPSGKYNPLFIYGSAGLGKTHLMQAIGHYALFNNQNKIKVKYTKTDDYINDYISICRKSNDAIENMSKFYKKYNNVDIILIDDIQVIESKQRTMEKMQHTFDTLYNKGKQIVITSDRIPKEIPKLTKALSTRFEMGLMIELTPPDYETRLEILKKIALNNDLEYELSALEYIAKNFTTNVRELEGAFTKVYAYAEMSDAEISLALTKSILKCSENDNGINFEKITEVSASYFDVDIESIKGSARASKVSNARQIAIYLCRDLTNESYENIAEFFNKKHSTILYSYEQIKKTLNINKENATAIREIKQALKVY